MTTLKINHQRVIERRNTVIREALRARKFSKDKLFIDAINFVEEGLDIIMKRKKER